MSRRVILTGAAGAIGAAIAALLAARDWQVIGIDRAFPDGAPALAEQVAQDIADAPGYRAALERILADGPVHGLVNCAGIAQVGRFLDQEPRWDLLVAVNLTAAIQACHAVVPSMIAAGGGSVVNIISDSARAGAAGEAVYSATKGGLAAFTRSLAQEVGRFGVRVNNVSPGPVRTPMSAAHGDVMDKLAAKTPMKRVAEAVDIAGAVAFFLGEDSTFVTGQTLSVSGGLTMVG
ncbi:MULTISPECIES: SDR family NAD(P)-dependent oxidoreductase [unclassified Sphingomonas]|uniref:SDR family NAD(P)-dependent oxidoreductase n=1 Tax=unclassified Sphingomonas TaxID=196159 RepID=UPI0006FDC2FA|nr:MULTISPECIES: SDR family oxidoreductase [unclassified Sphingomonas]KQX17438.1 short-chain dehydrogenase [Sphingomonas sp. Root1294]KQY70363.1 short-chain dehydrogenase [Sphingomonas sp. Root50]KRB92149.1 short-chain dehydrogenase [Sphingomonas sp. Root720]